MTNRAGRSSEPNDELNLSDDEIERRLSGGAGLGSVTERAAKPAPKPKGGRSGGGGLLWRDVGLVLVLLLFLGAGANFVLNPAHATNSPTPGSSEVALASPSDQPTATPVPTAPPIDLPSDVIGSLAPEATPTPIPTAIPTAIPTSTPVPTPTLAPGATPKPPATATLHVYMDVITDEGGNATGPNWTVTVTGASPSPASFAGPAKGAYKAVTVRAGVHYAVTASGVGGYALEPGSDDCSGQLAQGAVGLCTITENDLPPHLTVYISGAGGSVPVTINGGHANPSSFSGDGGGTLVTLFSHSPYTVSAGSVSGYTGPIVSAGCTTSRGLSEGASQTCTFTYQPTPTPTSFIGAPLLPLLPLRRRIARLWSRHHGR